MSIRRFGIDPAGLAAQARGWMKSLPGVRTAGRAPFATALPDLQSILSRMPGTAPASASASTPTRAGILKREMSFGPNPGALEMWTYEPSGMAPRAPLVVLLHGCRQAPAGFAQGSGWIELARAHGFALLCVGQTHHNNANNCLNWFETDDIVRERGEAASIAQMVRHLVATRDLDAERIHAFGLSAGGAMTVAMLAAYPELFRSGASIAGLPYGCATNVQSALAAMRQVPVLAPSVWGDRARRAAPAARQRPRLSIWHGTQDATVAVGNARALAAQWLDLQAIDAETGIASEDETVRQTVWRDARGQDGVELVLVRGMAHGVPVDPAGRSGVANGAAAPFILDMGLSAARSCARAWGLIADHATRADRAPGVATG